MGVWSTDPTGSDEAQEWLDNAVYFPLMQSIGNAFDAFMREPTDDLRRTEVEVAAALVVDLVKVRAHTVYHTLDCELLLSEYRLIDRAHDAVKLLLLQPNWFSDWNDPDAKMRMVQELAASLKLLASPNEG